MPNMNNNSIDLSKIYNFDDSVRSPQSVNSPAGLQQMLGYNFLKETSNVNDNMNAERILQENMSNSQTAQGVPVVNDTYNTVLERVDEQQLPTAANGASERAEKDRMPGILSEEFVNSNKINADELKDFLKTQEGKTATVKMLLGKDALVDNIGTILFVGNDYILLKEANTGNVLVCPLEKLEFVRIS